MAKAKSEQPRAAENRDSCFTIMPFGGWFDKYYEDVFSSAITDAGLLPRRADDVYRPGTIVNDIWQFTKEAKVILADLTGKNPNVLYELGLAHALAKPVIIVSESLDDIPFDLRALRIVEYDKKAPNWGDILKRKITRSIKEVLESPLKSILPVFLEVDSKNESKKLSQHDKEMLEIRRELDLLRREVGRTRIGRLLDEEIDPGTAKRMISELVKKKVTTNDIVRRMRRYGPPSGWIIETVEEVKAEIADDPIPF